MKELCAVAAALVCLRPGLVLADTLSFASPGAPRAAIHQQLFEPWIKKIVAESEGTLRIRTFYSSPLGNYRNMYDRVRDGVVNIAFTTLAPIGGQFVLTDVASLPFEVDNSLEGSIALWKLYESGSIAKEFEGIKLLGLFIFPNSALHMNDRPIRTLEDFSGVKLRTAGKLQSDTVALLGGSPVTTAIADTYAGLERGLFAGAVIPWTGIAPFKLDEVTHYHLNAPLGSSVAMIFMNQQSFDNLPPAAQRAIANNSGLSLSILAGRQSDSDALRTEQRIRKQANHTIYDIAPAEAMRWKQQIQPVIDRWVAKTPDGRLVLAAFRNEIARIRAAQK